MSTRIYKSLSHGWTGETVILNKFGYDWTLRTIKSSSGKIVSSAQAGKKTDNGFSFSMFTDPNYQLLTSKGRATEKTVKAQHYKALNDFETLIEKYKKFDQEEINLRTDGERPLQVGHIMRFHGYGKENEKLAVYNIEQTKFGENVRYVNLDTLELGVTERVRPISKKFGIGIYYYPNEMLQDEKLQDYVIDAKAKEIAKEKSHASEKTLKNAERQAKIEEGKKIVKSVPTWAKSVIIGQLMEDKSDAMTDYFHSSVSDVIYLAFSKHNRDVFSEMRKAAEKAPQTKFLANGKEFENRHKYSMGDGYYLGEPYSRSGWRVRKNSYTNITTTDFLEDLQVAAAEGRYFIDSKQAKASEQDKAASESMKDVKFNVGNFVHSKNGKKVYYAAPTERLSKYQFSMLKSSAKTYSGWYSRYSSGDAVAGFLFYDSYKRDLFANIKSDVAPDPVKNKEASLKQNQDAVDRFKLIVSDKEFQELINKTPENKVKSLDFDIGRLKEQIKRIEKALNEGNWEGYTENKKVRKRQLKEAKQKLEQLEAERIKLKEVAVSNKGDKKPSSTITDYDELPKDVQDALNNGFNEDGDPYKEAEAARQRLSEIGWGMDYDLSGTPSEFWRLEQSKQKQESPSHPKKAPQAPNRDFEPTDNIAILEYEVGYRQEQIANIERIAKDFKQTGIYQIIDNLPKITPESARKETGAKTGSGKDIATIWLDKNGVSVERASEKLHQQLNLTPLDEQEIRQFIIDIIQLPSKKAAIDEYTGASDLPQLKRELKEWTDALDKAMEALTLEVPDDEKPAPLPAPKGKAGTNEQRAAAKKAAKEKLEKIPDYDMNTIQVVKFGRQIQALRGYYGEIDLKADNSRRLAPTKENLVKWANNMGRFDLIGVDNASAVTVTVNKKKAPKLIYVGLTGFIEIN